MNIVILTNHTISLPVLHYLVESKMLKGIGVSGENESANQLVEVAQNYHVPFFRVTKENLATALNQWLGELKTDTVFVLNFSSKIPEVVLSSVKYRFYNFHFSLLPAYRGPTPIFWQIKNGEKTGGITVHQVNSQFDSGAILFQKELPFFPGENYGIYMGRLSNMAVGVLKEAIQRLEEKVLLVHQKEALASYFPRPCKEDLVIDWRSSSAEAIENLVNACNPVYGGAITFLKGITLRILEVSPASIPPSESFLPGTIAYSNPQHGVFVACKAGACLRLNIINTPDGILSGYRMAALGLRAGEKFETLTIESKQIS